jgi:hypothetical protein
VPLHDRVDDPDVAETDKVIAVAVRPHARPLLGETKVARVTVPAKPFCEATESVELAVA